MRIFLSNFIGIVVASSVFSTWLVASDEFVTEPLDSMTIEEMSKSGWTDHVLAFNEVFKVIEVKSLLEFGVGRSTKYFLDNVPKVVSLEIASTHALQQSLHWYQMCVKKFMPAYQNWRPTFRFCSEDVDVATVNAWKGMLPESLSSSYMQEIADTCTQGLVLLEEPCMLAFIDSGPYGRVDLVNEILSRKVPIVAAHDTGASGWEYQYYAYDRLKVPEEYMTITFPVRAKITFWIRKDILNEQQIDCLEKARERVALQLQ
jgi:hypothetical protein